MKKLLQTVSSVTSKNASRSAPAPPPPPKHDHVYYVRKLAEMEEQRTEKRVVFTELTLGPNWTSKVHPGIADVASLKVTWSRWDFNIFEVKATRSDFLADTRKGKWRKYLEHCTRFYFAAPEGVIKPKELPDEAGLVLYYPERGHWRTIRHPKNVRNNVKATAKMLRAMVFYLNEVRHPVEERARRIQLIYAETRKSGSALHNLLSALGNEQVRALRRETSTQKARAANSALTVAALNKVLLDSGLSTTPYALKRELAELQRRAQNEE